MLSFNLRNVLLSKGIDNPLGWLTKRKVKRHTAKLLLSGKTDKISTRLIETICYELNILMNDLYLWQSDSTHKDIPGHPLQEIRAGEEMPDVNHYNKRLTLANMRRAEAYMKQLEAEQNEAVKQKAEEKKAKRKAGK